MVWFVVDLQDAWNVLCEHPRLHKLEISMRAVQADHPLVLNVLPPGLKTLMLRNLVLEVQPPAGWQLADVDPEVRNTIARWFPASNLTVAALNICVVARKLCIMRCTSGCVVFVSVSNGLDM